MSGARLNVRENVGVWFYRKFSFEEKSANFDEVDPNPQLSSLSFFLK